MSHSTIYAVFRALPEDQRDFWEIAGKTEGELAEIVREGNLDLYHGAGSKGRAGPSAPIFSFPYPGDRKTKSGLNSRGRMFHYLPVDTDVAEGYGAWQSDSEAKWRFVMRGFRAYLRRILSRLQRGDKERALVAACALCHFLQDQTAFFHSLEGEEGCSPWILDELIPRPDGCLATPTSLLGEATPDISIDGYGPRLLGMSVEEACFHLYQRYRTVRHENRQTLIPLVQAQYRGDLIAERELRSQIGRATAELTHDLLYTIACLARAQFGRKESKALARVDLCRIKPVNYPRHVCPPYRFNTMVLGHALNLEQERCPLRLVVREGNATRERLFRRGIGLGCHREVILVYPVPKGVYRKLTGFFGLHSRLGQEGAARFEARLGSKPGIKALLDRTNPSVPLDVDIRDGGLLKFQLRSKGKWNDSANNLVFAEPTLVK